MPTDKILAFNLIGLLFAFLLLWGISLFKRDASIVDPCWGMAFVLIACLTKWLSSNDHPRAILLTLMMLLWGVRLSAYLTWRNWGKGEDFRYAAMREHHGSWFPLISLITVFGLQGLLAWFIALPVQLGIVRGDQWHLGVPLGIVCWLVGICFESIGDYQLARFKSNPANRGKVLKSGLWRYTRHPNYFGDFLVWWGFFLVAVEPRSWWWTWTGPALMSFLLMRISGVRLLENSLRQRVDGYEQYVRNTSAFFPWPPRRNLSS